MTSEQKWMAAVIFAKQLGRKPRALDKGILWAHNRMDMLKTENATLAKELEECQREIKRRDTVEAEKHRIP